MRNAAFKNSFKNKLASILVAQQTCGSRVTPDTNDRKLSFNSRGMDINHPTLDRPCAQSISNHKKTWNVPFETPDYDYVKDLFDFQFHDIDGL